MKAVLQSARRRRQKKPDWAVRGAAVRIPIGASTQARDAADLFLSDRLSLGSRDPVTFYVSGPGELAEHLFSDYPEVWRAWHDAHDALKEPHFTDIERATWAIEERHAEAAFRLGIEVGRRLGGAR